jgi:ribosomal protein S18
VAKQRKRPARTRRDRKDGPTSGRRKPCPYCREEIDQVDYKDASALRRLSPSAARSARAGSRERAAAIRARSRAQSSARASLRRSHRSLRAGASAGIAASGPAVAAETGSEPKRRRGPPPAGNPAAALSSFPRGAPQGSEVHIECVIGCRERRASPVRVAARSPRERVPRFSDSQLLRGRVVRRGQSDILNR